MHSYIENCVYKYDYDSYNNIIIANSYTNFQLVAPLAEDPIGDGIACSERGQVDALSASENFENFPRERIRGKIVAYVCVYSWLG